MKKLFLLFILLLPILSLATHCEQYTDKWEAYQCYKESAEKNRLLIKEYMQVVNTMPLAQKIPIQRKHSLLMKEIKDVCKLTVQCTSDSYESYAERLSKIVNQ